MKTRLIVALASLAALSTYAGATTSTKKKGMRQTNPTSHVSSTKHSKKSGSAKGRSRTAAHARSARQLAPTADRYREIQKALADRGYLKNEPTGTWDAASQEAMRKFQSDQKLDPSGKITAASLIGLGLGPKTETQASASTSASQSTPRATTSPE
jgi:Putative peptidoglycan binding domain